MSRRSRPGAVVPPSDGRARASSLNSRAEGRGRNRGSGHDARRLPAATGEAGRGTARSGELFVARARRDRNRGSCHGVSGPWIGRDWRPPQVRSIMPG